jgi:hypothetical protein
MWNSYPEKSNLLRRIIISHFGFLLVCMFSCGPVAAQPTSFFYKNYSYGSDAMFNPLSFIASSGFDELQIYGHPAAFRDIKFSRAARNVWMNIKAPFPQINIYGWGRFLQNEILPSSLNPKRAQWFPNYTLHLVGGGMAARKAAEWFEVHGYPEPMILAALSSMAGHYVNEMIEQWDASKFYPNVDPIADLLFFDPLGILLFTNDDVARFFSEELSLNDWSTQPALSFLPLGIRNASQNFVIKVPITSSRSWNVFYHFGAFGILGLSHRFNETDAISVGAGLSSKKPYVADVRNGAVTYSIVVGPVGGIYFDRNNSLLAALVIADSFTENLRLNVYPGLIEMGGFSPGLFVSAGKSGITAGLTVSWLPLGIAGHH